VTPNQGANRAEDDRTAPDAPKAWASERAAKKPVYESLTKPAVFYPMSAPEGVFALH